MHLTTDLLQSVFHSKYCFHSNHVNKLFLCRGLWLGKGGLWAFIAPWYSDILGCQVVVNWTFYHRNWIELIPVSDCKTYLTHIFPIKHLRRTWIGKIRKDTSCYNNNFSWFAWATKTNQCLVCMYVSPSPLEWMKMKVQPQMFLANYLHTMNQNTDMAMLDTDFACTALP